MLPLSITDLELFWRSAREQGVTFIPPVNHVATGLPLYDIMRMRQAGGIINTYLMLLKVENKLNPVIMMSST